jgi:glucose-1-phosphate adenylyltransferase
VLNIDLSAVLEDHAASGAYMTIVTKQVDPAAQKFDRPTIVLKTDADNRITDLEDRIPDAENNVISTNIMVIARTDLQNIVTEALARGHKSFHRDVIAKNLKNRVIRAYPFNGWYSQITSLEGYFESSMQLLTAEARRDLFGHSERHIYTKVRNSAPAKYAADARVKNSLIADGCVIEGEVENCILFRNVHIGKGTVVKNCILLQDTYVGANASLNCVITDKNAVIKDDRTLSGHCTMPFFIGKGEMV